MDVNMGEMSDREVLVAIVGAMERFEVAQGRMQTTLGELEKARLAEIAGCVFHPSRGENGKAILARMSKLEKDIGEARAFVRGLLFLGLANLATVAAAWLLPLLQRLLGGP